ncbi:hypothetical protein K1T71_012141 [Dendrolimus kikuchii]|uniref:Uncharacterized protein n=2 Tax=Dendrolimus kikuchii TaxID=765133 RepID=A0ACC1CH89_9NEOP|nr:hypothetical protein K1T71_014761 [Dendrolimus kikuchii]KAJ0170939.1 hypothetical protein K1T71_013711 [Dendrolimus kikuchii]KAJ0172168.1 hypothetical protein K1T71_012141 [Dendrolimus kikuchii]
MNFLQSSSHGSGSQPDLSKLREQDNSSGTRLGRKKKREDEITEALADFRAEILSSFKEFTKTQCNALSSLSVDLKHVIDQVESIKSSHEKLEQEQGKLKNELSVLNKNTEIRLMAYEGKLDTLQNSVKFSCDQYEDINVKINSLHEKSNIIESMESKYNTLLNNYSALQREFNSNNQRDRLLNIEIVGIPELKNENLETFILNIAKAAGVNLSVDDILDANRITPKSKLHGRPRNIVVKLKNRILKENIISGTRRNRITTKDLDLPGDSKPIFINEHLTPYNKQLLKTCKDIAKTKLYQYVWTRNGRIFVRKNDTTPAFQIVEEGDINKFFY